MKKTLISYRFSPDGDIYLDSYLQVEAYDPKFVAMALKLGEESPLVQELREITAAIVAFKLRSRANMARTILLNNDLTREECEALVKTLPPSRLKELSERGRI